VVSDLSALGYSYRYGYKKSNVQLECEEFHRIFLKVFVSFPEKEGVADHFFKIDEKFQSASGGYIVGTINVDRLKYILKKSGVSAVLIEEAEAPEDYVNNQVSYFEDAVYWRT
jgi:homoserine dehydrogenase